MGDQRIPLLADDVAEHRFAGTRTMGDHMVVAQAEGGAVLGVQRDQAQMLLAHVRHLGAHGVDQFIGFAPGAGRAFRQRLAEVEREQGGAHAGEGDLLDRVVVLFADAQPRIAVAAAVGGVVEQGGGLVLADDVDARAVRREPACAERAAVVRGQLAAVSAAPFDGQRRLEHEVGMGKCFGAGGEADRVRGAAFCGAQLAGIGVAGGRALPACRAQFVAGLVLLVVGPLGRRHHRRMPRLVLEDGVAQAHQ